MPDHQALPDARTTAAALRRVTMAELRALAAVKAAGSLSAAAKLLDVSQPTLSQHVRDIEDKLGLILFQRHRRGIEPTPAGLVMLRLASTLQMDMALASEGLALSARDESRPVRVGSMALTSGGLLALAVGRYAQDASQGAVVVAEGPRETLLENLRHGRIDLFIGRLPSLNETTGLQQEVLFQDSAVAVVAKHHPLARRSKVPVKALLEQDWILPAEDTAFHQQLRDTFRLADLALPQGRVMSYSMLAIPAIVSTSNLVGFMPTSLFAAGTISGSLHRIPLELDWVPSAVGIVHREGAGVADHVESFMRILRAVAASARSAQSSH